MSEAGWFGDCGEICSDPKSGQLQRPKSLRHSTSLCNYRFSPSSLERKSLSRHVHKLGRRLYLCMDLSRRWGALSLALDFTPYHVSPFLLLPTNPFIRRSEYEIVYPCSTSCLWREHPKAKGELERVVPGESTHCGIQGVCIVSGRDGVNESGRGRNERNQRAILEQKPITSAPPMSSTNVIPLYEEESDSDPFKVKQKNARIYHPIGKNLSLSHPLLPPTLHQSHSHPRRCKESQPCHQYAWDELEDCHRDEGEETESEV